jgi:RNA polymerase sigma factor (sigma-70 family)
MTVEDQADPARTAIEKTFRERSSGFLAWARRYAPDPASAEDALQDAFVRAIANASALSMVEDAAGWIFSVLRNRLVDLWRGRKARQRAGAIDLPAEALTEIAAAAGLDPLDALVRDEMQDALLTAIEALPAEQRDVLRAQALDGVGFRELSERTGVSINTLMARKRRAVRKLAAALEYWMED